MALAISCPHCEENKVETVRSAWYIMGFLLFASWGSQSYIGCSSCTRNKVIGSMVMTSVIGWWCFPWGLGTPIALMQNLVAIAEGPNENALRAALAQQGIDMDELELDENGRSAGETKLVEGILATLHLMTWADGSADPREIEAGVEIAQGMLGDAVSAEQVSAMLKDKNSPGELDPYSLQMDQRIILLRAAGMIAAADEDIADEEKDEMRRLGQRLEIPDEIVARLIELLEDDVRSDEEVEQMKAIAADSLGVPADATIPAIKAAYERKCMVVPDDEEEAAEYRGSIDWAYQTLIGVPPAA